MKTSKRVAHLASFCGNIGDQLNHQTFQSWFQTLFVGKLEWNRFEIRDCYRRKTKFNPDFIQFAKTNEIVVIGGGNFFELWPNDSENGTSIDLSIQEIHDIDRPIIFNAIGVDTAQGISKNAKNNFKTFFEHLTNNPKCFVSVRNDGSFNQLLELGIDTSNVYILPDAVFFYKGKNDAQTRGSIKIGINIAEDMSGIRYGDSTGDEFLRSLTQVINDLVSWNKGIYFIFLPHIYSDLFFISKLLKLLPEEIVRTNIVVEKYSTIGQDALALAATYANCDLVLATRFHASVLAIGLGVPTIGLNTYPQIQKTYDELGLSTQCISPAATDFENDLKNLIHDALRKKSMWKLRQFNSCGHLAEQREYVRTKLAIWLERQD